MTGILRVAKEGIFSGLNNIIVHSILDDEYSSYFGLTEKEVEKSLEHYEMEYSMPAIREWYNGYKFGNSEVYNPWSIINYISKKSLEPYWISTSSNVLINQMLDKAKRTESNIFKKLESLFEGKTIFQSIQKGSDFHDMVNVEEIWQLFLYRGYLTVVDKEGYEFYELKIPNKEIYSFFRRSFIEKFITNYTNFSILIFSLERGELKVFEEELQTLMLNSLSYYDVNTEEEKFYHIFMIGLLASLQEKYYVHSNRESGLGRYDIVLESKDIKNPAYIMEFKVAKVMEELENKAREAIVQIEEKKYDTELKSRGIENIIKLGIAFCGKKIKIISK